MFLLTRRQLADIDGLVGLLRHGILIHAVEGRPGQGHETGTSRFENAEGGDELEEGVNPGLFGGTVIKVSVGSETWCGMV